MNTSVYEHAVEAWSKADFPALQRELDSNVLLVKDKETSSLESRKILADATKKFKKLEANDKLGQVNKIIKHYQKEIDNLTQRSKYSEQLLLDIYAKIAEAPDPIPLFQDSVSKLSKVDDSDSLKEKITTLEEKLAKYADYETLKGRLLDLEQNSAVILAKRLTAKEQEVTSTWEEKKRHWDEKKTELTKQIEMLQEGNRALEAKISQQVDLIDETYGDKTEQMEGQADITSSVQYNLLAQELESAQSRIFQLEKRNETLNGSLAKATSEAEKESELHTKQVQISHLESENALLSASLEQERKQNSLQKNDTVEKMNTLQGELKSYKSELDSLRRKLHNYSDYNEIKNELSALKKIEFGADSDSEDNNDNNDATSKDNNVGNTILNANKKLQSLLAELRVDNSSVNEKNNELMLENKDLQKKVEKLSSLNKKLETDLEKIDNIEDKFNDTASMVSTVTRQMNNRKGGSGRLSPTSSIIGIPEDAELQAVGSSNNTILPIITKQRDRFRVRNTELEKQVRQFVTEKNRLKSDITKLKEDNSKLYERIRYISSYNATHNKKNNNDITNNTNIQLESSDPEAQYLNNYEESLHPLANFKKKELAYYKNNRLSLLEKLFLSFANIILQNKTTRMVFLFYCIGLHGLMFLMSMYVVNLSGYMTPEVGIVHASTTSNIGSNAGAHLNSHVGSVGGAAAAAPNL